MSSVPMSTWKRRFESNDLRNHEVRQEEEAHKRMAIIRLDCIVKAEV